MRTDSQSNLPNTLAGVVIESWHYDPTEKAVILRLVNHSQKDVTAFKTFRDLRN